MGSSGRREPGRYAGCGLARRVGQRRARGGRARPDHWQRPARPGVARVRSVALQGSPSPQPSPVEGEGVVVPSLVEGEGVLAPSPFEEERALNAAAIPSPLAGEGRVRGNQKGHSRLKFGARFSRSDESPSRTSGPVKPSISSASEASKVGPAIRSQLLRLYFVQRSADCDPRARRRATSSALSASSLSSTLSETRP